MKLYFESPLMSMMVQQHSTVAKVPFHVDLYDWLQVRGLEISLNDNLIKYENMSGGILGAVIFFESMPACQNLSCHSTNQQNIYNMGAPNLAEPFGFTDTTKHKVSLLRMEFLP